MYFLFVFFFSSRRRHTRFDCDWSSDVCSSDLYGVSAAVRRNPWIDRERMGIEGVSYGGQLTDWLITQTNEFKAAVPRSEERRVGEEGRSRWSPYHLKKKKERLKV